MPIKIMAGSQAFWGAVQANLFRMPDQASAHLQTTQPLLCRNREYWRHSNLPEDPQAISSRNTQRFLSVEMGSLYPRRVSDPSVSRILLRRSPTSPGGNGNQGDSQCELMRRNKIFFLTFSHYFENKIHHTTRSFASRHIIEEIICPTQNSRSGNSCWETKRLHGQLSKAA